MGCTDRIKSTCGKKIQLKCAKYEGKLSKKSKLDKCDCLDGEEVIEDINTQLDEIQDSIDVSGIQFNCIDYEDSTIPDILQAIGDKVCEIADKTGLGDCPGCGPTPDPCANDISCCGAVVVGMKYWTGDSTLTDTIGSWTIQTGTDLQHTINSGSGYYRIILEHSVVFEDDIAYMDVGLKVNTTNPSSTVTGFDITRMKEVYPKTIILYVNLNQGDVITPAYKRLAAGVIQFDIVKMMIEKIAYIPG